MQFKTRISCVFTRIYYIYDYYYVCSFQFKRPLTKCNTCTFGKINTHKKQRRKAKQKTAQKRVYNKDLSINQTSVAVHRLSVFHGTSLVDQRRCIAFAE